MSDIFKNDLVDIDFVAGEQPTHIKLDSVADQLRLAIRRLGVSVGDVYTQQTQVSTSGQYDLAELSTAGPNLNRLIGSAGWLNPGSFGRTEVFRYIRLSGHNSVNSDPPTIDGFSHYNRREFKLPSPPIIFTSSEGAETVALSYSWTLGSSYWNIVGGSHPPTTRVDDLADLNAAGEYHVSPDGVITLYTPLGSGQYFDLTYKHHPLPDAYDGASLNVIPDFSQTGTLCTVVDEGSSVYSVTLPTHTGLRSWPTLSSWTPPDELVTYKFPVTHPTLNHQLLLPAVLRDELSTGDIIPEGYIQLWDDTTGTIVSGLDFTYEGTNKVHCTGAPVTPSTDRYRLVVPGTNLARTVYSLRENYRWHDHSGRVITPSGQYMGHRIRHYDNLNLIDEGDEGATSPGFVVSEAGITRNPHPMYFHRYGWEYNNNISDEGNFSNAFMGHLVLGSIDGDLEGNNDSFRIYFHNGVIDSTTPQIYYDSSEDRMSIEGRDVYIKEDLYLEDDLYFIGSSANIFLDGGDISTDGGNIYTDNNSISGSGGDIFTDGGFIDTGVFSGTGGLIKTGGGVLDSEGGEIRSGTGTIDSEGGDIRTDDGNDTGGGNIYTGRGHIHTGVGNANGGDIYTHGGNIYTGESGATGGLIQTFGGNVDTDGGDVFVNAGDFRYGQFTKKTQRLHLTAAHAQAEVSEWTFVSGTTGATNAHSRWKCDAVLGDNEGLIFPIHLPEEAEITYVAVKAYIPESTTITIYLVSTDLVFGTASTKPGVRTSLGSDFASEPVGGGNWVVPQVNLSSSPEEVLSTVAYEIFVDISGNSIGSLVYGAEVIFNVDYLKAGVH